MKLTFTSAVGGSRVAHPKCTSATRMHCVRRAVRVASPARNLILSSAAAPNAVAETDEAKRKQTVN